MILMLTCKPYVELFLFLACPLCQNKCPKITVTFQKIKCIQKTSRINTNRKQVACIQLFAGSNIYYRHTMRPYKFKKCASYVCSSCFGRNICIELFFVSKICVKYTAALRLNKSLGQHRNHDITKCRKLTLYFMYPVNFNHIQAENDNYILAAIK